MIQSIPSFIGAYEDKIAAKKIPNELLAEVRSAPSEKLTTNSHPYIKHHRAVIITRNETIQEIKNSAAREFTNLDSFQRELHKLLRFCSQNISCINSTLAKSSSWDSYLEKSIKEQKVDLKILSSLSSKIKSFRKEMISLEALMDFLRFSNQKLPQVKELIVGLKKDQHNIIHELESVLTEKNIEKDKLRQQLEAETGAHLISSQIRLLHRQKAHLNNMSELLDKRLLYLTGSLKMLQSVERKALSLPDFSIV